MIPSGTVLLGIDGGGSSCRAAAVAGGVRYEVTLGPANVTTGFDGAVATIVRALGMLADRSGLPSETLFRAPAHLGLAGVVDAALAERVRAALPLSRATVTDDRPTTIAGALGPAEGAVVAIGTGSFLGRQEGGRSRGLGGWGFFIGDQASGAWLGRRCLEEVMLAVDGLAAETGLVRTILSGHGGDPAAIVRFSVAAHPADYAGLARAVVAAAAEGDPLGARLMAEGADYIRRGLAALGWQRGGTLCLTGGLGPAYAGWLGEPVVPAKGSALDGALLLAAQTAGQAAGQVAGQVAGEGP
ncbi:BadF/BadG/BcrA/BcrD ATPase family protein [Albidovulum sp.]|uniref:BadF/BadG/BcrA/BcrD ATPase family protein n=1 Tax=Albidovulum sp. TaxID=1872424 RepID=UPI0039B95CCC